MNTNTKTDTNTDNIKTAKSFAVSILRGIVANSKTDYGWALSELMDINTSDKALLKNLKAIDSIISSAIKELKEEYK